MSELKFSCPHCGQHIAGTEAWAGRQIDCPNCGQAMTVPRVSPPPPPPPPPRPLPSLHRPAPPSATRPTGAPPAPKGPAPSPEASRPATAPSAPSPGASGAPTTPAPAVDAAARRRLSPLAVTSLVSSLVLCLAPLSSIAGVVCGHLARRQFRREPGLRGSGLATAGLIIGYIVTALAMVSLILWVLNPRDITWHGRTSSTDPAGTNATGQTGEPGSRNAGRSQAKPEQPSSRVTGKVGPHSFTCEDASLANGWLTLRQGKNFIADAEVKVVLFSANGRLDGKTITVGTGSTGTIPHIHLGWKTGNGLDSVAVSGGYTMTLKFERFDRGTVRGHIDLDVPGPKGASVKGDFVAAIQ